MFAPIFSFDGGRAPWHCADIPFCFRNTDRVPYTHGVEGTGDLERQLSGAFVSFAKTGNPNNPYIPAWHPVESGKLNTMVFDDVTEERTNYDERLLELIEKHKEPISFHGVTPDEDEEYEKKWVY